MLASSAPQPAISRTALKVKLGDEKWQRGAETCSDDGTPLGYSPDIVPNRIESFFIENLE
jgi:hypothetical protein